MRESATISRHFQINDLFYRYISHPCLLDFYFPFLRTVAFRLVALDQARHSIDRFLKGPVLQRFFEHRKDRFSAIESNQFSPDVRTSLRAF